MRTSFVRPADGSGPADRLTESPNLQYAATWSPSDQALVFVESRPETGYDILVMPSSGDRRPRPLVQTRFAEAYPDLSPDGRWLAYSSDESGRPEVYVQPYPGPWSSAAGVRNGGTGPAWSHDGRELFYTHDADDWRTGYVDQDDGGSGHSATYTSRRVRRASSSKDVTARQQASGPTTSQPMADGS